MYTTAAHMPDAKATNDTSLHEASLRAGFTDLAATLLSPCTYNSHQSTKSPLLRDPRPSSWPNSRPWPKFSPPAFSSSPTLAVLSLVTAIDNAVSFSVVNSLVFTAQAQLFGHRQRTSWNRPRIFLLIFSSALRIALGLTPPLHKHFSVENPINQLSM